MSKLKRWSLVLAFSMLVQAGAGLAGLASPVKIFAEEEKNENYKLVEGAEDKVEILRGETLKLEHADDLTGQVEWRSINKPIAEVDNEGLVSAGEKGVSIIIAEDEAGNTQEWEVSVLYVKDAPQVDENLYKKLRGDWLKTVIGDTSGDQSKDAKRVVERINTFAERHWESMDKDGGVLWDNAKDYKTNPAHTRTMYLNLEWMAKAYSHPASNYYENPELLEDIKYALDWLHTNAYNVREQYGNWWQWEIGIPKAYNNINIMLYDELGKELINEYTDVILFHQPGPFHSGSSGVSENKFREAVAANKVDVSLVSLVAGMLKEDYEQLLMTRDAISSLLKYEDIAEGLQDGFYEDGSFIQHGHVPYVGTYGQVFLNGISTVTKALESSEWQVPKESLDILASFAMDSYVPFIYKGAAMDMTRGRAIARDNLTDEASGRGIISAFVLLAETLPEDLSKELKSYIKYWVVDGGASEFLSSTNNIEVINLTENILKDASIEPAEITSSHRNFPLMDRAVHTGEDYALGLSMFSSRVSNFEYMNGENIRGWHTADGMYYLYNEDTDHYSDNYWNTVNPYRLPGTTVDTASLDKKDLKNNGYNGQKLFQKEDWVGGTKLGAYGVQGMNLNGNLVDDKGEDADVPFKTLRAKKSYFMFDDELVMLGTGINSNDDREIETIIENRKIKDDGSNKVVISGETLLDGPEENNIKADWVHLEGNTANSHIGYYFPQAENINIRKVENKGSWADIKAGASNELVSKNYLEMWLSHGENPTNDAYEFVLLPGMNKDETKEYSRNPQIEVLENNSNVQAVKEKGLNIVGANFWNDLDAQAGKISVNKKASVIYQEKDGVLEISIADPTMKNEETIEVEFDGKALEVISKDEQIEVKDLDSKIKLSVNVKDSLGKTFTIKLKTK